MTSSSALIDDRPFDVIATLDGHASTFAESSDMPEGRPDPPSGPSPRVRTTGAGLYRVAVVAVIAAFVASLVFLVAHEPGDAGVTTTSWPVAAAGMVGMLSAVAGYVLAFLAAFRSDSV
jgi:hypothetical protein